MFFNVIPMVTSYIILTFQIPMFVRSIIFVLFLSTQLFPVSYCSAVDEPLYLTPLLRRGEMAEARRLSRVDTSNGSVFPTTAGASFAGFLTIDDRAAANIFFWLTSATSSLNNSAPVVLWLQGGPGQSALFGLLVEHGPYAVGDGSGDKHLLRGRERAWTEFANVLYVDSPIGAGFSFTRSADGLVKSVEDVAEDLVTFLDQWLAIYPMLRRNEWFISGEAYGGKYAPVLAARLVDLVRGSNVRPDVNLTGLNLVGLTVGGGFTDPLIMTSTLGQHLYGVGAMNGEQASVVDDVIGKMHALYDAGEVREAYRLFDSVFFGTLLRNGTASLYKNATGCSNYFNFGQCALPSEFTTYAEVLKHQSLRRAIHVGKLEFNALNATAISGLIDTFLKPASDALEKVLAASPRVRVLYYTGAEDTLVPAIATELFVREATSVGAGYARSARLPWCLASGCERDSVVAGYSTDVCDENGGLVFRLAVISGAGHVAPHDRPDAVYQMMKRFVTGIT